METPTAPSLLALTLRNLRDMATRRLAGIGAYPPLLVFLWGYLNRAAPRLERLLARWHAGRLAPSRPKPKASPRPPMPHFRLPTANAWLVRLVQPTVQFAGQIETIIARPEIQELLAAAPQAGRIFRPLYRMLGIPLPPSLRLPARPRRPRPAKVAPAVKPLSARARQRLLNYSPGRIGETHRRLAPYRQEFSPA